MRIGAHQSISGGLERAIESAVQDGCESVQIFTRNQSQWKMKPLADEMVATFTAAVTRWGVGSENLLAHDSYLINLAAADASLRKKSLDSLIEEIRRCTRLGVGYLVMHPGSHVGQGEQKGLRLIAKGIERSLQESDEGDHSAKLLLENTAGQGTNLGYRFEQIRDLIGALKSSDRVGVCIDTQHTFAAGYDLSTKEGYEATFTEMDKTIGLDRVRAFHINDSKRECGSRVDRHERIGEGFIGKLCFQMLMNDKRFTDIPGVLELPAPYSPQLTRLRRLADGVATSRRRPLRVSAGKPGRVVKRPTRRRRST